MLHENTRSYRRESAKDKVFVCFWKWKNDQITNVDVEIKLKEEMLKQIMVDKSIKTLGVCVNLKIEWKDQCE